MKTTFFLLLAVSIGLISLTNSAQCSKGWNGIIPLHSTRADVERRLGVSEDKCGCIYKTANENIFVDYAEAPCKGPIYGWNVPAGTVLQFTVYPKTQIKFSELGIDEAKFVKTSDSPMTTYFTNAQEGIKYAVQKGYLAHTEYIPSDKDAQLRCKGFPAYDGGVTEYRPFARFLKY